MKRALTLLAAVMISGAGALASASTLTVDPANAGKPDVYATLADAISVANTGDTIEVVPGTYNGETKMNSRSLVVRSLEGPLATKLTGGENLLTISTTPNAGTVIEGFTFEAATGSAVRLLAAQATFRNNRFVGNGTTDAETALQGGAIFASSANGLTVENCVFENNKAVDGGALYSTNSVRLIVRSSTFTGNEATQGGVAGVQGDTDVTVASTFACDNSAASGAVWWQTGGSLEWRSGVARANQADEGAVFRLDGVEGPEGGPATIANAGFQGNSASAADGGTVAWAAGTALKLTNSVLVDLGANAFVTDSSLTSDYNAFAGDFAGWVKDADVAAGDHSMVEAEYAAFLLREVGTTCAPPSFEPMPGSPVLGLGDPALKNVYSNKRSDIGPYGGPEAIAFVTDSDGDTRVDVLDNCPDTKNADQADFDGDGIGDVCDDDPGPIDDPDNDGVKTGVDNCPNFPNPKQEDNDNDGQGDPCDGNDDNDPVPDNDDCAPFDPDVYPGQIESCNGKDDNCNELIDEGLTCFAEPADDAGTAEQAPDATTGGGDSATGDSEGGGGDGGGGGGGGCRASESGAGGSGPLAAVCLGLALAVGIRRSRSVPR